MLISMYTNLGNYIFVLTLCLDCSWEGQNQMGVWYLLCHVSLLAMIELLHLLCGFRFIIDLVFLCVEGPTELQYCVGMRICLFIT